MAFIAPVIAVGLGLGAVGTAFVTIGIGLGLSYVASRIAKKRAARESGGSRIGLQIDPNSPREVIFGTAATGGTLRYYQLSGSDNSKIQLVVELAGHQCDSLVEIWSKGEKKTWNPETGVVDGFSNLLKVRFYSGSPSQLPDPSLVMDSGGNWTVNDVGRHVCYVVVEATYNPTVFPGGVSDLELTYVVKGASVYDQRLDSTAGGSGAQRWNDQTTWAWSDNPAVLAANIIRGFGAGGIKLLGMSAPADAIRFADYAAAANACDETVSKKAGGTEKRYRFGGVMQCRDARNRQHLERVIATMAGDIVEAGGIYRILAGVARTPVAALTDADLIPAQPFVEELKRSRKELLNAVSGQFSDPSQAWFVVPLPMRTSSADETIDGGTPGPNRYTRLLDLSDVFSRSQAQRIMEIERKRGRRQARIACTVRARWFVLEPGDWVTLTSSRRGFSGTYEVIQKSVKPDLVTVLYLAETDDQIDDWNPATDEIDDNALVNLPSAGPTLTTVSGLVLTHYLAATGSGAQRPGLSLTWTPITDGTVLRLQIQYRRFGDSVIMEAPAADEPSDGAISWLDGVQSGVVYEARARPVTQPARAVTWSSWVSSASSTGTQVVPVALLGETVPPGSIGDAELDARTRFLLEITHAQDTARNSIAELNGRLQPVLARLADELLKASMDRFAAAERLQLNETGIFETREVMETNDAALAAVSTSIQAALNQEISDREAAVTAANTARIDGDAALATSINTVAANLAAESTSRANADTAINASITDASTARVNMDGALATQVTTTVAEYSIARSNSADTQMQGAISAFSAAEQIHLSNAAIRREEITRANAIEAEAAARLILQAQVTDPVTGLPAQVTAINSLTTRVTTAEGTIGTQGTAITGLTSTVGGHTDSIAEILSLEGGNKRYMLVLGSGNKIQAIIAVDGSETRSSIAFGASEVLFYDPTVGGGTPLALMALQTIAGIPQLTLNGTLIANAIKAGTVDVDELSAIVANLGTVTAGKIQNASGSLIIDADDDEPRIRMVMTA